MHRCVPEQELLWGDLCVFLWYSFFTRIYLRNCKAWRWWLDGRVVLQILSFYSGWRKWLGLFYCVFKWDWDRYRFNPNCWGERVPRLTVWTKLSQWMTAYTIMQLTQIKVPIRNCKWKHFLNAYPPTNWTWIGIFVFWESCVWKQMFFFFSCCKGSSLTLSFCALLFQHYMFICQVFVKAGFSVDKENKGKM